MQRLTRWLAPPALGLAGLVAAGAGAAADRITLGEVRSTRQAYAFGEGKVSFPSLPELAQGGWDILMDRGRFLVNQPVTMEGLEGEAGIR
ncbi:MAG: hypothetical protein GWN97_08225, partial [Thermoplasmata archaeon]|nr:hypothetical protein [Thermoplasmata archaeon]